MNGEMKAVWSLVHVEVEAGSAHFVDDGLTDLVDRVYSGFLFYLVNCLFF